MKGAKLEDIGELLGHTSLTMTKNTVISDRASCMKSQLC
jgi:hypothetical protein